jgi:hypothetical protein
MAKGWDWPHFFAQQSPGQQDEPGWQQLMPQQEPSQHLAPFLQQSPVSASADNDESDNTRTANNLNRMGFSSP